MRSPAALSRPQDAAAYCEGHPGLLSSREAGSRFTVAGWAALAEHPALLEHAQPLHPSAAGCEDGTDESLRPLLASLLLSPAGGSVRLHVPPRGAHSLLSQVCGRLAVVAYPPSDGEALSGVDGQSCFDPWSEAAPVGSPHSATLRAGDTLLLPRGWWLAFRWLQPGVTLRREWFSLGPHADGFAASLAPPPPAPAASTAEPDSADGCALDRAQALRQSGNAHFAGGALAEAQASYSAAIQVLAGSAGSVDVREAACDDEPAAALLCSLLSNRAACSLRMRRHAACVADCTAVLRATRPHDESTAKALFRRARAKEALGDADGAMADFGRLLELQPGCGEAREALEAYHSPLHRIVVMSSGDEDMRRRQRGGL